MSKLRRKYSLAAASTAVDWTIYDADDYDVQRIGLVFASTPVSVGDITVTLISGQGPAFNLLLRSVDPRSGTHISIEHIEGMANGDKIQVEYANPDTISVALSAVLEL